MRGLTQVAALLSSVCVSAFVIPNSWESRTSGGVIDYQPLDASLKFTIDGLDENSRHPVIQFHVAEVDKACGESNVEINGQQLESTWDGIEAHGNGYLDVYNGREAIWSIHCLYDSTPSDGSFSNGDDVIHLLRLRFEHSSEGFTISYKQKAKPAIVRFSPIFVDDAQVNGIAGKWRQPSLDFDQDIPTNNQPEAGPALLVNNLWYGPQRLLASVSALKTQLKDKIQKIAGCNKHKAQPRPSKEASLELVPFVPNGIETSSITETQDTPDDQATSGTPKTNHIAETDGITNQDEMGDKVSTAISENTDSTNTTPGFSAAETRSLHASDSFASTPSTTPSSSTSASDIGPNYRPLKAFALVLIMCSLLVWCVLRWKDPRRRVDRAARCEERRNRRLYKRAARHHKIKTWLWSFRMKFKLASSEHLSWNEKRARVSGQEDVLENAMKNDIRALRNAHRIVSNITAAEEGRNEFGLEAGSSERRRSVATLPGYESEETQPPSYEASRSFEGTTLVGSSTFAPADIDSNPDSSVVSTSPRISRDGTNSDFDEKIEALSLDPNSVTNDYQVYNHV